MKIKKDDDYKCIVIKLDDMEYQAFVSKMSEFETERKFYNAFERFILPFFGIKSFFVTRKKKS